jgi:hypothetical protein
MSAFSDFYARQIEADLDWREKELAVLKMHLLSTRVGSTQEVAFLRTNLAMIYAHYEGFCKFAIGIYIDALEARCLKPMDLKWPIAMQSFMRLQSDLKQIENPADYFAKLLSDFNVRLMSPALFEKPEKVANLWPDLLSSWLSKFGLSSALITKEKVRLKNLVESRNHIAHGKKLHVTSRTELDLYAHAATLAMHEVAVGVIEGLEGEKYIRSGHVMTIMNHAT